MAGFMDEGRGVCGPGQGDDRLLAAEADFAELLLIQFTRFRYRLAAFALARAAAISPPFAIARAAATIA